MTPLPLSYDFQPGQPVRLLSGPFANQQGTVAKVSDDWGSVWVQDRGERVELITQLANLAPLPAGLPASAPVPHLKSEISDLKS